MVEGVEDESHLACEAGLVVAEMGEEGVPERDLEIQQQQHRVAHGCVREKVEKGGVGCFPTVQPRDLLRPTVPEKSTLKCEGVTV